MSTICYAPNAVPVAQLGPCNNNTDSVSLCCSPGQYCLTNGLCATGEGQFYSGACTDKTYKAAICPSFCMGASKFVVQCKNSQFPDGGFCCDADGSGSCCRAANNALDLAPAVTSAMVSPTASPESTTSTSEIRSSSISSTSKRGTLSLTTLPSGRAISSEVNSIGSVNILDYTSTNSVTSSTTATLVSASPSSSGKSSGHHLNLGTRIGLGFGVTFAVLFTFAACVFLAIWCFLKSHPKRSLTLERGRKRRMREASKGSESKDQSAELGCNPVQPAELGSNDDAGAPVPAPGLTASRENIARLAEICGRDRAQIEQRLAMNPALRPNNPQGPLPLPASPSAPRHVPSGSSPPPGPAFTQMDGASSPPPTPVLPGISKLNGTPASPCTNPSEDIEVLDTPTGAVPTWISQLVLPEPMDRPSSGSFLTSFGDMSVGNRASFAASSVYSQPITGLAPPPNSAAQPSTLSNSSSGSSNSWSSGKETVLDVGLVLYTADTESEQGDISPLSSLSEPFNDNELQDYLKIVGWEPKLERIGAAVATSADEMAKDKTAEVGNGEVLAEEEGRVASDSGVEVGESGAFADEIAV